MSSDPVVFVVAAIVTRQWLRITSRTPSVRERLEPLAVLHVTRMLLAIAIPRPNTQTLLSTMLSALACAAYIEWARMNTLEQVVAACLEYVAGLETVAQRSMAPLALLLIPSSIRAMHAAFRLGATTDALAESSVQVIQATTPLPACAAAVEPPDPCDYLGRVAGMLYLISRSEASYDMFPPAYRRIIKVWRTATEPYGAGAVYVSPRIRDAILADFRKAVANVPRPTFPRPTEDEVLKLRGDMLMAPTTSGMARLLEVELSKPPPAPRAPPGCVEIMRIQKSIAIPATAGMPESASRCSAGSSRCSAVAFRFDCTRCGTRDTCSRCEVSIRRYAARMLSVDWPPISGTSACIFGCGGTCAAYARSAGHSSTLR